MSITRYRKEPLELVEISDSSLRKNVFREIGRDLSSCIKAGVVTDTPGEIARLMEKAFRAGLELGADPRFDANQKTPRRTMTDMDIPSLPRDQIYFIRHALGIDGRQVERRFRETPAEALVLIMRPKIPGLPSTLSRDEWLLPHGFGDPLSNKVVNPLIKLGLYHEPQELGHGWKVSFMSEWGFELLTTGKTRGMDDRRTGTSSTVEQYLELVGDDFDDLFQRAGRQLGIFKTEPERESARRSPVR